MTKFKLALLAAATIAPAAAQAQNIPAAVVAVVDRERVANECNACKTASGQIQALIQQAQARQATLGSQLQTQEGPINTEATRIRGLPEGAAKQAAITALQPKVAAFQAAQQSAQQELQRLQANAQSVNANVLRQINEKMNPIIAQVMQQRGANIAVDQDATLAAAKSVDVTDAVLAALNTQLTTISATPLPQQAAPATGTPATTPPKPVGR
jgi:outer membrane protein